MNILEIEDMVKGLPDDRLQQEAEMPTGQVPQFLVVSEIQRRSDMRRRFAERQQQQPQGTVKDQIIQEGIAAMAPPDQSMQAAMMGQQEQMPPQMMPPEGMPMPPEGMPMEQPPMGMYGGGVVRMFEGGKTIEQIAEDLYDYKRPTISTRRGARPQPGATSRDEFIRELLPGYEGVMPGERLPRRGQRESFIDDVVEYVSDRQGLDDTGPDASPEDFRLMDASLNNQEENIGSQMVREPAANVLTPLDNLIAGDLSQDPSDVFQNIERYISPEVFPDDITRLSGSNAIGEDAKRFNQNADASNIRAALGREKQAKTDLAGRRIQQLEGLENKFETYAQSIKDMKVPSINYSSLKAQQQEFAEGQIAEAKKAGAAQALIALGAGIARGDIAEGLSEAGKATAAANAEKRAIAARNKAAEFGFTKAEIDNEYNRAVKEEENRLRAIETEIGALEKLGASRFAAEQFAIVSETAIEQAIANLNQSTELALAKVANDRFKQEELLKREVLRAASNLLDKMPVQVTQTMEKNDIVALQSQLAATIGEQFGLTLPRITIPGVVSGNNFEDQIKNLPPDVQDAMREQRTERDK
tara:strand:- start:11047 stop:12804 length:1758 start_codon:yes stop_codon:yes gene_type:complete